ncbi:MAG: sigma-70 family RNA polymerase sigma factor [Candidatus Bipolaricaulota bacterium]|nr:sigma-70 family RNA polymerase sigma factor [Candidatus Bipolaricaulota bacterium]MDW8126823.1 sigma-70 family RNA polymerase sigma factor [Candidatus Bipolaricaulota bacterium]
MPAEELELIHRSLNGDLEAWGEIVARYKQAVFAVTLSILRNYADAEDATQDAFIRAYENLRKYDLSRKFSTWLFTVAANVAKNALRKRRREREPPLPEPEGDPAEEVHQDIQLSAVRQAVAELPEGYRAPVILYYWHGLPLEEIAQVLGLPLGTVKTRLFRARSMIKMRLVEQGVIHDAVG